MKNIILITLILTAFSTYSLTAQDSKKMLNDAIYMEQVSGDIQKAIEIYNSIVNSQEANREVKAKALLHLGLSHEKLGNQKAQKYYQMILDQYTDQDEYLSTAKSRLSYIVDVAKPGRLEKNLQSTLKLYSRTDIYGTIANDGSKISYVDWTKGNLAIYNVNTGQSEEITTDGGWGPNVAYSDMSVWSPDNNKLVYLWLTEDSGELRLYDLKKQSTINLLDKTTDRFPYPIAWTKNNKILINYGSFDRLTWSYYLLDPQDGSLEELHSVNTNEVSSLESVNISPDGEYMAYYYTDTEMNYCHIYKTGHFNGNPISVIENLSNKPFWSDNMDKIYFTRSKINNTVLLEASFNNGTIKDDASIVVENLPEEITHITLDPNSRSLHYVSTFNQFTIYKTELDWNQRKFNRSKIMVDAANGLSGPSWSPDGRSFVYIKSGGTNWVGSKIILKNTISGDKREYELGLKSLETNYFLTNMHWSPSGNNLLVTYKIYDEKDVEHIRMALLNLETGKLKKFEQDIVRPAVTLTSDKDIYYFEKGKGIVHFDIEANSKKLIYQLNSEEEMLGYLKRNKALDQLVFCKAPSSEKREFKELVHLDLTDNSSRVIISLSDDKSLMYAESPQWHNDDKEILIPIRDNKKQTYQFHTIDLATNQYTAFGEEMNADLKERWLHISLDNSESNMLFMKRVNSAVAWTINNF